MASDESSTAAAAPTPRTSGRRLWFAVLVLGLLSLLVAPFFVDLIAHGAPRAVRGEVSYRGWGPLTAPVELTGQWRLEWKSAPAPGTRMLADVPGVWAGEHPGGPALPVVGAASYHLTIRDLPAGRYTLFVPTLYGATRVAVNGRTISQRGVLGTDRASTVYEVRSHEAVIDADGAPIDLQIDMATFHHRDNGLNVTPLLGLSSAMSGWITLDWLRSFLLITSLLLLACYGLVVFLFRPQDRASLWFAMACLTLLPLVAVFSHDNLLMIALPFIDFRTMLSLQYVAGAAALGFILGYTNQLFPRENLRIAYWALQALTVLLFVIYAVLAVVGDTLVMSQASEWSVGLRSAAFVYMLGVVGLASWRKRDGAVVFLLGLAVLVSTLIYTDLVTNAVIPRVFGIDVLPIGILLLLFSHIVILAERWSIAIGTAERTNADLRRLLDVNISITSEMRLEALLKKIVQVTSKVIHADRSSLFLHDPRPNELWSVVAEGVEEKPIRIAADKGIAGWSFSHGEPVSLSDAYADPRFNREVDAETGYKTESVLAVPVTARDGKRVGVMQALNHHLGDTFGEGDVERMSAFAAQAAIAIDNATLFSEVSSERNYNESILRSMTAGVVTLDRDGKVAKVNDAAARILDASIEAIAGRDGRAWLSASNPALLSELDAVAGGGGAKTLIDAELKTARGRTISANISIVPLVAGGEASGLVVLIEDITDEKRMEGAMRRFMTQSVVDQVLLHDELQFGAACRASVLFADIRNFTTLAEAMQPRETVDMLNEIFAELVDAVVANEGVLDKFLGDAVMAVYGAPLPMGRDPLNAVTSARQMVGMVEALNERRRARGATVDLRLGVGLATGDVIAGTIGSAKRMDYTVIGDAVNLAARLEPLTKLYQVEIVVCETTAAAVAGEVPLRELDTIRVKGRRGASKIFQVLVADPTPALEAYRQGRDLLERRRWKDAVAAFEAAAAADPADGPSALMLDRARILAKKPPPADWDGVWETAGAA